MLLTLVEKVSRKRGAGKSYFPFREEKGKAERVSEGAERPHSKERIYRQYFSTGRRRRRAMSASVDSY